MTAAPTYNRSFSFTNFQALNPATPLPGVNVDIELSSVKVTLDALIANAGLIQRSDGMLANGSVGPQQLQSGLLTGIAPPTQWAIGVNYDVGSTVFAGLLFYVCKMANLSTGSNPPASTPSLWTFLADFSGVTIVPGSVTSAAFAPGAVNSAALGPNLALLASPSPGDNSTAIATTAFVDTAISAITSIAATPAQTDNSTKIATTAFVQTAVASVLSVKNRVINGSMAVDQRNGGASGTAVGYTVDRWKYISTQSGKATWQQLTSNPPSVAFPFYTSIITASAYSLASTDNSSLTTTIEAADCADLLWGTASAVSVTLTFWAKALVTGTYGGSIRNSGANRSYPFSFSLSGGVWAQVSVTIPGDTSGTWLTGGTGAGMVISFGLGSGSTFLGTAAAWQAGNFTAPTGTAQIVGAASNGLNLTGVALQAGGGTPDFRPIAQEIALCQRYYESASKAFITGNVTSGSTYFRSESWKATKRVNPTTTITLVSTSGLITPTKLASDTNIVVWQSVAGGTTTGGFVDFSWTADADF